jgi:hypothetical protein
MALFNYYMKDEHCKLTGITTKSGFLHNGHECIFWNVDSGYASLLLLQNLFFVAIRITPT